MTTCEKKGQHRFEPRYSDREPEFVLAIVKQGGSFNGQIIMERIYECDVCVRCGLVVKKPVPNA